MTALWILLFILGIGCPVAAHAAEEPLAVVDGVAISSEEVEKSLAGQLSKLEEQIYNLKRQKVDALINEKLLEKEAAKRKLTVPALLDAEVTAKVRLVTEQEIENFYQANVKDGGQACLIDLFTFLTYPPVTMARKPRVHFPGALYHLGIGVRHLII